MYKELNQQNPFNQPIKNMTLNELAFRKYDKDNEQFKPTRIQIPRMPTVLKTTGFMLHYLEHQDRKFIFTESEIQRLSTILGYAILMDNTDIFKIERKKREILQKSEDFNQQVTCISNHGFSFTGHFYPSRVWLYTVEYVSSNIPKLAQILNLSIPETATGIYAIGLGTAEGISKFNIEEIHKLIIQFNIYIFQKNNKLNGE